MPTTRSAGLDVDIASLTTIVEQEIVRASSFGRPVSLVVVHAVDPRGGAAGLMQLARDTLRPVDRVAHGGSGALHIVLPECGDEQARATAHQLRRRAVARGFTLRCGIAAYPSTAANADDLLSAGRRAARAASEREPVCVGAASVAQPRLATYEIDPEADVPATQATCREARSLGRSDRPLVVRGERGTGKYTIARVAHRAGPRARRAFVLLRADDTRDTSGAVDDPQMSALLAVMAAFRRADSGTLVLQDLDRFPSAVQEAVLRVLQINSPTATVPLAAKRGAMRFDVQIVASVDNDAFEDGLVPALAARMRQLACISLTPLRQRSADIVPLARYFAEEAAAWRSAAAPLSGISEMARQLLRAYSWPGNLRELRNVIERAVVLAEGDQIRPEDLPPRLRSDLD